MMRIRPVLAAGIGLTCLSALGAPVASYQIVHTYPHDRDAFTQGLLYLDGKLFEGTGLNGRSSIREVELETGKVIRSHELPERFFGEGLTDWEDSLIELTWKEGEAFVYDRSTFTPRSAFSYHGEGWGLTHDKSHLIMSDGSSTLRILDPKTFEQVSKLDVTDNGRPIDNLNELEYVRGEILANVWQTNRIARISPQSGQVTGWIDLSHLLTEEDMVPRPDVLNGIAYDAKDDRLFVTGKLWPKLFEIKIVKQPAHHS